MKRSVFSLDMNDRVKIIRKSFGLNQEQFAKKIQINQRTLSSIERDVTKLTDRNLKQICTEFRINEVWLHTGEGTMLNTSDVAITCSTEELNGIKKYRALDEHGKKLVNLILTEEYLRVQKTNFEPK